MKRKSNEMLVWKIPVFVSENKQESGDVRIISIYKLRQKTWTIVDIVESKRFKI
jgi:hypothetical protein